MTHPTLRTAIAAVVTVAILHAAPTLAQTMTVEQARKQVAPFYEMLNQPAIKDLKSKKLGEMTVYSPTIRHELDDAIDGPNSVVRRYTLIGGLLGVSFGSASCRERV